MRFHLEELGSEPAFSCPLGAWLTLPAVGLFCFVFLAHLAPYLSFYLLLAPGAADPVWNVCFGSDSALLQGLDF